MKTVFFTAALSVLAAGNSWAGEASPAPAPQPNTAPPPACDPAAYVAGVDVTGREVAPADLAPQGTPSVGTVVIARVRTPNNPTVRNVEVGVEIEGLNRAANPQPCAPRS